MWTAQDPRLKRGEAWGWLAIIRGLYFIFLISPACCNLTKNGVQEIQSGGESHANRLSDTYKQFSVGAGCSILLTFVLQTDMLNRGLGPFCHRWWRGRATHAVHQLEALCEGVNAT